jgi:hypothetical protein
MGRMVILNEKVKTTCDVAGVSRSESGEAPFAQKAMKPLPTQGRSVTAWMAAAMLAMTWASETQSSPNHARYRADAQHAMAAHNFFASDEIAVYGDFGPLPPGRSSNDKSLQLAQATTGDAGHPPEREHNWAETQLLELTIARRDIELLQRLVQENDRAEQLEQTLAATRREVVETQTALAKTSEEASRLKQVGESGTPEVQRSLQQERERSERLEQDLAAARRDVETQTALAAKASEEASRLKQAGESSEAELQKSLQQERERSARLEQDLAVARPDVETQTALAAKASEEASRLKQASESSEAELHKSLQQERERSARLEQDLAVARREVETQTVLAKASEEASRLKQAGESSEAELQKFLQQERERSARLEQDLAAARREVEAQTALAAKAGEEASRLKQASESSEAELQKSLQQERERSARLEQQDLAAARRDVETQTVLAAKVTKEVLRTKLAAEADAAELRQSMQKERERADALAHDLSMTRSALYAYEAHARKVEDEAAELRQAAASGTLSLRESAQDGRDQARRPEQDLVTARRGLDTRVASAARASEEVARTSQAAERDSASLRSSPQQERPQVEQLEPAPNAVTVGSIARDRQTENAKSIADWSPAAGVRSDAQPNSKKPAVGAALLARASALLRQGDISAARIVLERAVEMGSVQASFSLAETYDPLILAKWRTLGTRGDAVRAQDLYAKADAAGMKEAKARIEALRR